MRTTTTERCGSSKIRSIQISCIKRPWSRDQRLPLSTGNFKTVFSIWITKKLNTESDRIHSSIWQMNSQLLRDSLTDLSMELVPSSPAQSAFPPPKTWSSNWSSSSITDSVLLCLITQSSYSKPITSSPSLPTLPIVTATWYSGTQPSPLSLISQVALNTRECLSVLPHRWPMTGGSEPTVSLMDSSDTTTTISGIALASSLLLYSIPPWVDRYIIFWLNQIKISTDW